MYRHLAETWQKIYKEKPETLRQRAIEWRKERAIVRLEKPTKLHRARSLGYKAKQGFVVVRVRVGRGGRVRIRPRAGRRPKHLGVVKIKRAINSQRIAENRAVRRYPNLKVLGSYLLYEDGKYRWYEVIMVDPTHPAVKSDVNIGKVVSG
ncbi:MAG: 50S ribosomal protein L15e [Nitrososphaerales archaeon]